LVRDTTSERHRARDASLKRPRRTVCCRGRTVNMSSRLGLPPGHLDIGTSRARYQRPNGDANRSGPVALAQDRQASLATGGHNRQDGAACKRTGRPCRLACRAGQRATLVDLLGACSGGNRHVDAALRRARTGGKERDHEHDREQRHHDEHGSDDPLLTSGHCSTGTNRLGVARGENQHRASVRRPPRRWAPTGGSIPARW
jgi:hypothetical protein